MVPANYFLHLYNKELPHIDRQATVEKFGYAPTTQSPLGSKRVVVKCEFCLELYDTGYGVFSKTPDAACKKCDAVSSVYTRQGRVGDKHEFWLERRPKLDESKLDIQATQAQFGYSPLEIFHFSAKKIVAICDFCSVSFPMAMSKFTEKMSSICCSNKECKWKKTQNTIQDRYGVSSMIQLPGALKSLTDPSTERTVAEILESRYPDLEFVRQYPVGPYLFDFYFPTLNLLLEIQGDYYHQFKEYGYLGSPKDRSKSSYVEKYTSYKLSWIYEHEIQLGKLDHRLSGILGPPTPDSAVIEIDKDRISFAMIENDIAFSFLSYNHYLGNIGGVSSHVGVFYDKQIVGVLTMGGLTSQRNLPAINNSSSISPSLSPGEIREIRRFSLLPEFVSLSNFVVESAIEFFRASSNFRAVLKYENPYDGVQISGSGWITIDNLEVSYHYLDRETNKWINRQTIVDKSRYLGMTEAEFAHKSGLSRVNEVPKKAWLRVF